MGYIQGHEFVGYRCKPPFAHTSGPRTAKIALVGEAHGEQEEMSGVPFFGSSGQELTKMLREAGIDRKDCFLTNVFAFRPPGNQIAKVCGTKAEVGKDYKLPQLSQGLYVLPEFLPEVERLRQELMEVQPNLIVALGGTACWALQGRGGISAVRGTVAQCQLLPGKKCLPTYHPAGVMRQWAFRPIVVVDLMKAAREMEWPEIRRPQVTVTVDPTLQEVLDFCSHPHRTLSFDVETSNGQITMLGFAPTIDRAFVVPFWDKSKPGWNYWSFEDEKVVRLALAKLLQSDCPKAAQNGLYDLQYLWREGLPVRNFIDDTMLLHHSLYPEMQKGLGFLGSIYTNHASWKLQHKSATTKRDDI